ncbi:MAG: DUF2249 domain-containing protein [Ktedonobacterales bacterium]|jgi:uncharacterized protein (DUF2249 family)
MSDTTDTTNTPDALDVREIPPTERHPMIFRRFAALPVGEAFILINDHDPRPLYFQLNFEYNGQIGWDYLEQGPTVWRVRVSRTTPSREQRSNPLRVIE